MPLRNKNFFIILCLAGLILVLIVTGCGSVTENMAKEPIGPVPVDARPVLRFGASPFETVEKTRDQLQELMTYIERKTGMRVELMVSDDYQSLISSMSRKELDFALFGPYGYVQAHEVAGARALVAIENNVTGRYYHSLIIAHPESGIKGLAELKGRSFAFVDEKSTSGYLSPTAVLRRMGLNPALDFRQTVFAGSHDAVILAVKRRTIDAGVVSSTIYQSWIRKGLISETELLILDKSAPIPGSVWAYRQGVAKDLIDIVGHSLVQARQDGALGVFGKDIGSFYPTDDKMYDVIREAAQIRAGEKSEMRKN